MYVGCANGIIRVMTVDPVKHAMTVVKPHYLGVDVAEGQSPEHLVSSLSFFLPPPCNLFNPVYYAPANQ